MHDVSREHIFLSGMGSLFDASKDIGMGVTDLAFACGPEPVVDEVCTAVVGSARTGRVLVTSQQKHFFAQEAGEEI